MKKFPWISVLFVIFLTLKLTGTIAWSWWWVTAPLWIPFGLAGIVFALLGIVALWEHKDKQRKYSR